MGHHRAVVSSETLIQLDLLNNTWLYAAKQVQDSKKQEQCLLRIPLCIVTDENGPMIRTGIAKISSETAFNILFPDFTAFRDFQEGKQVDICLQSPVGNCFFEPPVADKIVVSVVRSPFVPCISADYDECLRNYFRHSRHLALNQIFGVPYDVKHVTSRILKSEHYLWFKVVDLKRNECLVDSAWVRAGQTMMSENGSVSASVPFGILRLADHQFKCVLSGLQKQYDFVINLLAPAVRNLNAFSDVSFLVHGPPAAGKRFLAMLVSNHFHLHFYDVNCCEFIGDSLVAMEHRIASMFDKARYFSPCLLLLRNIHAFSKGNNDDGDEPRLIRCLSDNLQRLSQQDRVLIMASTNCMDQISSPVTRLFSYHVECDPPEEETRLHILNSLLQDEDVFNPEVISKNTAGMVLGDFLALAAESSSNAMKRSQGGANNRRCKIGQRDIEDALEKIHAEYKDVLGMPNIPQVSWSDVGGLEKVKAEIIDTIKLPMQHPELMAKGLRRSGLLLYGPPGCGKTLLAKAVATEFSLNFFSVKGPELMNMYVGQSEQNVRDMFKKARESSPCIIFFDELDSIAPNRGRSGDSGGVMDRIVSQLLAELDGLQTSNDLFVIGATNRPDLLDNALLRPGRFDEMVYVGFPETSQDRLSIMTSYTKKMRLHTDVDLRKIENLLPLYLTGADFYALCSDAYLNGIKRCIDKLSSNRGDKLNEFASEEGLLVELGDFEIAMEELVPSVSMNDILKYKEIKKKIDSDRQNRL